MKRFLFIFILLSLTVSICIGQSRPDEIVISYNSFNKPLKLILKELASISKVNLVYSESRIPAEKMVTINAKNEKLGNILSVILEEYDITYQIVGDQLVLVKDIKKQKEESITIYGYVKDNSSGEVLIGANVFLHDRSKGTVSNEYGFYSFKVSKQTQRLHYSYLGYKSEIIELSVFKDTLINIKLHPDGFLNEIVIMGDLLEEEHESTASQQNLHIDKILSSNHLVGEADLFRYLSNQPGISTAADGIGGLNVRGGSADQNLVLLDGVPVYNTGHALGIFSIFNSNSIKSASFYKGSIPARYVWIKQLTKYQNNDKERRGFSNYFFNDFNAKLNFKIGQKHRLLLSTFHSNDAFSSQTKEKDDSALRDESAKQINWGNQLYSLRFNSQITKSFFSRFTLYHTGYTFNSYRNNLFENVSNIDTSVYFDAYLLGRRF
ncbi:MAG: carboxypeptidase-like regulatory domain-containing protein [Saprospiraceae bacterium]|nr:carboxypeptidase-like regulatory domain-containing protein [Saprospiraceae bacterium]